MAPVRVRRRPVLGVVTVLMASLASMLCFAACASILGIEDAKDCGPKFDDCDGKNTGSNNNGSSSGEDAGLLDINPDDPLCERYCDAVEQACQGEFSVYGSRDTCEATCEALPAGEPGDDSGNTVECRINAAYDVVKTGEFRTDCPVLGPGGDGKCGENCDGYCTLMRAFCQDDFDTSECELGCEDVPTTPPYNFKIQDGNSLECRLYHVTAASVDANRHCIHAAGAEICVDDDASK